MFQLSPATAAGDSAGLSPMMRLILHGLLVGYAFVLYLCGSPQAVLITCGFFVFIAYLYFAWAESRYPIALNPLSFHFVWSAAALGVAPVYFGTRMVQGDPIEFAALTVGYDDIAYGYILALSASLILHLVLQVMKPTPRVEDLRRGLHPAIATILYAIGTAALAVVSIVPSEDRAVLPFASLIGTFQYAPYAVLMLLALRWPRSRYFWPTLVAATIPVFSAALLGSSKFFAMLALFPLALAVWTTHKKAFLIYGASLVILYFTLIAPTVSNSRIAGTQLTSTQKISKGFDSYSLNESDFIANQWDGFMYRIFDVISIGYIVSETNDSGLLHGATMDNLVYGLVPRILWHNKPTVSKGLWFSTHLTSARSEDEATTSTAMTAAGELYWNFGWFGVIAGMTLIAVLYAGLWRFAVRIGLGRALGMLVYFIVVVSTVNTSEASSLILTAFNLYLFIFASTAFGKSPRFIAAARQVQHQGA